MDSQIEKGSDRLRHNQSVVVKTVPRDRDLIADALDADVTERDGRAIALVAAALAAAPAAQGVAAAAAWATPDSSISSSLSKPASETPRLNIERPNRVLISVGAVVTQKHPTVNKQVPTQPNKKPLKKNQS